MTAEKIKKLGWIYNSLWNNRNLYTLSKESEYIIFEHNGEWGITDPFNKELSLIYCDLSENEIEQYTELIKMLNNIYKNPKNHSFYDFRITIENIKNFINKMNER